MTLVLAQDGYGPSNKLQRGLDAGVIDGCVLSPHYRSPEGDWASIIGRSQDAGIAVFDPKTYLLAIPLDRMGKLLEWPYWQQMLADDALTNPSAYAQSIQDILTQQQDMGFSIVVASGPLVSGWGDYSAALLDTAIGAAVQWKTTQGAGTSVYAGVTVSSGALGQVAVSASGNREVDPGLASWLDNMTGCALDGMYLVVDWENAHYELPCDEQVLANLMYATYTLSANQIPVTIGYTGLWSVLAMAAGANAVATGWHLGLRRLSTRTYHISGQRGGAAHRRLWLEDLLCEVTEAEIPDHEELPAPSPNLSDTMVAIMSGDNIPHFSNPISEVMHNWDLLHRLAQELGVGSVEDRITALLQRIDDAETFAQGFLCPAGLPQHCVSHLPKWREAVRLFLELTPDLQGTERGADSAAEGA